MGGGLYASVRRRRAQDAFLNERASAAAALGVACLCCRRFPCAWGAERERSGAGRTGGRALAGGGCCLARSAGPPAVAALRRTCEREAEEAGTGRPAFRLPLRQSAAECPAGALPADRALGGSWGRCSDKRLFASSVPAETGRSWAALCTSYRMPPCALAGQGAGVDNEQLRLVELLREKFSVVVTSARPACTFSEEMLCAAWWCQMHQCQVHHLDVLHCWTFKRLDDF